MVATKTLRVSPDSELSILLRDALKTGESLVIETGDASYRLGVEADWVGSASPAKPLPTPEEVERSRAGILAAAGTWKDFDAEAFKAYIYERRRTSSRPPVEL